MTTEFRYSEASVVSSSTSKPAVFNQYGPALFTVAYVSSGKWKLTFDPSVDTTANAVYLVVTYQNRSSPAVNIGNLTVTALDSTVPVYDVAFPHKVGNSDYTSQRTKVLICNSNSYYIEVVGPTNSCFVIFEAYYTGINVS